MSRIGTSDRGRNVRVSALPMGVVGELRRTTSLSGEGSKVILLDTGFLVLGYSLAVISTSFSASFPHRFGGITTYIPQSQSHYPVLNSGAGCRFSKGNWSFSLTLRPSPLSPEPIKSYYRKTLLSMPSHHC